MFRIALRAIAFVMIALGFTATAQANGLVENAMQLWLGELRTYYDQTVDLLEDGKTNPAKEPAAKLHDLAVRMAAETAKIREQSAALAPELGAAWTDAEKLTNNFALSAVWVRNAIGKGKIDLNQIKADMAAADDAVNKSWEFTKNFGKKYGELVGGPVEEAKELFDGYLNDGYEQTIEYLEPDVGNTDDGKEEIDRLIEIIAKLYQLTGTASSEAAELGRPLQDLWRPAHEATNQFQEETEEVSELVGESEYDLSDMQDAYADLNAEITRAYKDVWDFGNRFRAICDNWS